MNNVAGNTWNSEVANNTDDHENQIRSIGRIKKSVSVLIDLLNIHLQHILLDLADNASENIRDRKPKKNIDIAGDPYRERMVQSIENLKTNNDGT